MKQLNVADINEIAERIEDYLMEEKVIISANDILNHSESRSYLDTLKEKKFPSSIIYSALNDNETGDAALFIAKFNEKLCYDHASGTWYMFNKNYWVQEPKKTSLSKVPEIANLYRNEVDIIVTLFRKCIGSNNPEELRIADMLADLIAMLEKRIYILNSLLRKRHILITASLGENSLGLNGNEWDRDPWIIGCSNGVIDLKTGECRDGKPKDYIKTIAPTEWRGIETPAPVWDQFLSSTFEDNNKLIAYLQRLFGYALIGETSEHIFPILWGNGRNGKGTLIETLNHVLGQLSGPIPTEMLLNQGHVGSSAAPSPDILALKGKRLVWGSETDDNRKLNIAKVKWLVVGDTLVGRALYKDMISFSPTHTLFLLTNHKPTIGDEFALWERVHLIPFNLSFVSDPKEVNERIKDIYLPHKLKAEASGIFAWLVRGCLEWQRIGLAEPEIVKVATSDYKVEEDIIQHFLDECTIYSIDNRVKATELYNSYVD